jgi:hypothetical protein
MAKVYSTDFGQRIRLPQMGPQDSKGVAKDTAHDHSDESHISVLGHKVSRDT